VTSAAVVVPPPSNDPFSQNTPATAGFIPPADGDASDPAEHPCPLGTIIDFPVDHPSYTTEQVFLPEHKSMMRLYEYCEAANCPHYFLDGILKIVGEEIIHRGFKPHSAPSRKSFREYIIKRFGKCAAEPVTVQIPLITQKYHPDKVEIPDQVSRGRRDVVEVVKFHFVRQILDLLDDRSIFGNLDKLVVNREDHFSPYVNTSGYLDEVLDGSWYAETVRNRKIDPTTEFLLPIICYMDKTGTDIYQCHALEPLIVTTPLIRRCLRNRPQVWRCLGFVPDLDLKSSATKKVLRQKKIGKGAYLANYHRCLSVLLEAVKEAEREGVHTWLRIGDQVKYVRLVFEYAFTIGDGKSGDQICCRAAGYTNVNRLSRSCRVQFEEADDPLHVCDYITADKVFELAVIANSTVDSLLESDGVPKEDRDASKQADAARRIREATDELNLMSSVVALNAFREIGFGGDKRGVYGSTPTDLMHAFQSGWLRYLVKLALDPLTPTQKKELDDLVDELFVGLRSSEKHQHPRTNFSHGFTNLTRITSDEWAGMLFTLLLVMRTDKGRHIMRNVFTSEDDIDLGEHLHGELFGQASEEVIGNLEEIARQRTVGAAEVGDEESQEKSQDDVCSHDSAGNDSNEDLKSDDLESEECAVETPCSVDDFCFLAEALLSFHAWYKYGAPYKWSVFADDMTESKVLLAVRKMMSLVLIYVPRSKGNGWKLQKFHDLLHLARDMSRFGSPQNFDAGPGESGLRWWAKRPALTSQKRGYPVFIRQVAARLYEMQVFSAARRAMDLGDSCLEGKSDSDLEAEAEATDPPIRPNTGNGVPQVPASKQPYFRGSSFTLVYDDTQGHLREQWAGDPKKRLGPLEIHPLVLGYFRNGPDDSEEEKVPAFEDVVGYTELVCPNIPDETRREGSPRPMLYRAHPNYHSEGKWYDWVIVRYDPSSNPDFEESMYPPTYKPHEVPAKLLCFYRDRNTQSMKALVHACVFRDDNEDDTVLTELWQLEYKRTKKRRPARKATKTEPATPAARYFEAVVRSIDVRNIVDRVFMVQECPGEKEGFWINGDPKEMGASEANWVHMVKKRRTWARFFI